MQKKKQIPLGNDRKKGKGNCNCKGKGNCRGKCNCNCKGKCNDTCYCGCGGLGFQDGCYGCLLARPLVGFGFQGFLACWG